MQTSRLHEFAEKLFGMNWTKNNVLILLFLSSTLVILMYGVNIKAKWWVIDDHEIVYFLGNDHILRANEILEKVLQETEMRQYPYFPRFRPVYSTLRVLECWVWGDKPGLWYAFRISAFAGFVSLFWYLISQKVGVVIGGFLSLYMATQTYWPDIIGRLGPSENYTILGLALFGLGIHVIYQSNKVSGWWYIFVGAVVCSGAKENFLFMILPLTYIVWRSYQRSELNFTRIALSLGACVWMAGIGFTTVISTLSYGGDVYGNSIKLTDRFLVLIKLFERFDVFAFVLVCAFLLFLKRWFQEKNPALFDYSKETAVTAIILSLIYISQIFIYNGEWPVGTRYDFPGLLIGPLMLVILISFLQKITTTNRFSGFRTGLILLSTLGVILLAFSQLSNVREIRMISNHNVEKTIAFSGMMEELADLGTQNPDHVFIIQANNPAWDYEPVFSYFRFLRFYDAKNQVSLLWAGKKPESYSNLFRASLASDLRDLSLYGKQPFMVAGNDHDFAPFPEIDNPETECVLVVISGKPKKNCSILVLSN